MPVRGPVSQSATGRTGWPFLSESRPGGGREEAGKLVARLGGRQGASAGKGRIRAVASGAAPRPKSALRARARGERARCATGMVAVDGARQLGDRGDAGRAHRRRRRLRHRDGVPPAPRLPRQDVRHPRATHGHRRHLGSLPLPRHPLRLGHVHVRVQLPALDRPDGPRRRPVDQAVRDRHRARVRPGARHPLRSQGGTRRVVLCGATLERRGATRSRRAAGALPGALRGRLHRLLQLRRRPRPALAGRGGVPGAHRARPALAAGPRLQRQARGGHRQRGHRHHPGAGDDRPRGARDHAAALAELRALGAGHRSAGGAVEQAAEGRRLSPGARAQHRAGAPHLRAVALLARRDAAPLPRPGAPPAAGRRRHAALHAGLCAMAATPVRGARRGPVPRAAQRLGVGRHRSHRVLHRLRRALALRRGAAGGRRGQGHGAGSAAHGRRRRARRRHHHAQQRADGLQGRAPAGRAQRGDDLRLHEHRLDVEGRPGLRVPVPALRAHGRARVRPGGAARPQRHAHRGNDLRQPLGRLRPPRQGPPPPAGRPSALEGARRLFARRLEPANGTARGRVAGARPRAASRRSPGEGASATAPH